MDAVRRVAGVLDPGRHRRPRIRLGRVRIAMKRAQFDDILPLSPLQRGLLFHTEFDAGGADVYAIQVVTDLDGPLDVAALKAAAAALFRRHGALRACFRYRRSGDP